MVWQKELIQYRRMHGRKIEAHIKAVVSPLCDTFEMTYCPGTDYSIITYRLKGEINVGAIIYFDHSEPCIKHKFICN